MAAAGPGDLTAAQRTGDTIALPYARHDRGAGVAPIPARRGMRCARTELRDQRRTLIGMPGGRTELQLDACWLRDGTPYAVRLVTSATDEDSRVRRRMVQVAASDPFSESSDPVRIPTRATTGSGSRSGSGFGAVRPFDRSGAVTLPQNAVSPIVLRVATDGKEIALATGWVGQDPLTRGITEAGPVEVVDATRTQRNAFLDTFVARIRLTDTPYVALVRHRPRGNELRLDRQEDTGRRDTADGGTRELVTIRAGR